MVKLLTPNKGFTPPNTTIGWGQVPRAVRDLVLTIKRFYKPDWDTDWRERFRVDLISSEPGYELIYRRQRLVMQYLRVGFAEDGNWRTFGLRKDFSCGEKVQTEDDISASVVSSRGSQSTSTRTSTTHVAQVHPQLQYRSSSALTTR
ncbi:MAG: hypothetical protein R3F11_12245 [Verrucomicrobiales bacterium]